jgi:hypothetical protein
VLKENGDQGFGGGVEAGHTNPPRALPEMGGRTPKSWKKFHLRENIADERQEHAEFNFSRRGGTSFDGEILFRGLRG